MDYRQNKGTVNSGGERALTFVRKMSSAGLDPVPGKCEKHFWSLENWGGFGWTFSQIWFRHCSFPMRMFQRGGVKLQQFVFLKSLGRTLLLKDPMDDDGAIFTLSHSF